MYPNALRPKTDNLPHLLSQAVFGTKSTLPTPIPKTFSLALFQDDRSLQQVQLFSYPQIDFKMVV
ncbi:hypothetical protein D3C71_1002230 [compost metagenome]